MTDQDMLSVNTMPGLCMDTVQPAEPGRLGAPMGMTEIAYAPSRGARTSGQRRHSSAPFIHHDRALRNGEADHEH